MVEASLQVLSNFGSAVLGALIALHVALYRFREEKIWEKRAAAYERVIEAFHKAKRFSSEHLEAMIHSREVDDERAAELRKMAKASADEIIRAFDIGSFILSDDAVTILARYEIEIKERSRSDSWHEYLEADLAMTNRHMKKFIAQARQDLKH